MIEAVVFDVDGVLVRSGAFGARLLGELGLRRDALDSFWRGPFVQCSLGVSDLKQEVAPFLEKWGYRGTVEDCLQAWFEADSAVYGRCCLGMGSSAATECSRPRAGLARVWGRPARAGVSAAEHVEQP